MQLRLLSVLIVLSVIMIFGLSYHQKAFATGGLVSWWTGDVDASDSQGINNGVLNGGAIAGNPGGVVNGDFSFPGNAGSYVEIPDNPSLYVSNQYTLDLWVKLGAYPPSSQQYGSILVNKWVSGLEDKLLSVNPNGHVVFLLAGATPITLSNTALSLGQWYHIVATYDGTNQKICINGLLDTSVPTSGNAINYNGKLYFGFNPGRAAAETTWWAPLNGQLDEVKWYNRGLTTQETQSLCAATPPTVSVTTPTNGATFSSGTVTITGTASSSYTTISNVQVSIDGNAYSPTVTNTGTAFSTWSYTATGLAAGIHSVTAKATDSQGLIGYSTNVVANTPIPTGNGGQQVVFDSNNGNIYVANYDPTFNVAVVSGSTNQVLTTIPDARGPTGIAFDTLNHYIYTADYNAGTVTVINDATNSVVGSPISVGAAPFGIIYVPNGDIYVANTGSSSVSVIDPSSNTVVATITGLGNHPQDFTYDSTHHFLYMTNQGASEVTVIDPTTNSVVGSPIPVGNSPRGLVYNPANSDIYVANNADSSVSIIDTTSNTVVSTLTGGFNSPTGVSLNPLNGLVYVANFNGNTLSVIDTTTNTIINPVHLPGSTYYYYEMFDPVNSDIYATSNGNLARVQTQTQFIVNSQVSTTTTLVSSANTVNSGQSVTLTATVNQPVPDGETITFNEGATTIGTGTTTGGVATLTSILSVGTHSITAVYSGDANYLSSTSSPVTVTVLSLLQEKQGVITSLQSLVPVNNEDKKHIKSAIEAVQDSVNPSLWQADGMHLNVKKGEKVFDDEKQAVDQLKEMIEDKKESTSFVATVQGVVNTLVDVDQKLAQNAVSDANAAANAYTGKSEDVKQDVIEAQKEIAKATDEFSKGHFTSAIEHYDNAWNHAQDAIVDTTQTSDDHDEDNDGHGNDK